ncbi:MAG: hypothetical protein JST76_15485, partial [Bacteroidetes bacterium]|nr:hypothetical protein [Bacteroidota bacterium]
QEDFNKALVYESEIFICLIGEDVGKFTKEEFDEAYARFKAKEKPFVMTVFFKEFTNEEIGEQATNNLEGWTRRVALQKYIQNDLQQFYGSFKNPDDIINQIDKTIAEDISIVKSVAP